LTERAKKSPRTVGADQGAAEIDLTRETWLRGADHVKWAHSLDADDLRGCSAKPSAPEVSAPCQYRHNCPDTPHSRSFSDVESLLSKARRVGGSHRKTAFSLKENVGSLVRAGGVENQLFLTPTLANQNGTPPDPDRAQACWRRFEKLIALQFPGGGVRILERGGKTLRLHYHVMLDVGCDVRSGYDFEAARAAQKASYRAKWFLHASANANLRKLSAQLHRMAKGAGFGEVWHCEPVRSEVEAIKCYLSKYISKHVGQRLLVDRGRRLVAYFGSGSQRREVPAANRFGFGGALTEVRLGEKRPHYRNAWAWLWRAKCAKYFEKKGISDMDTARERGGEKWCYQHRQEIQKQKLSKYPYVFLAVMDGILTLDQIHEAGCDYMSGPCVFAPFDSVRGSRVFRFKSEGAGQVSYAGKVFRAERVMQEVAAMKPFVDHGCLVIWKDGTKEKRRVIEGVNDED
jgi:hypothetical protein